MTGPLLSVRDLRVSFHTDGGIVRAVEGVDLEVERGETVALVGESGCGKSVTAMAVMRLLPHPPARIDAGQVLLEGEDLLRADEARMRGVRGNEIGMIFQEPMTSLNPVYTVGAQIGESLGLHRRLEGPAARDETIRLLRTVRIPAPEGRVDAYPHQLSGGMRQRVMIAMALACRPRVLIADEPTTAVDVTVQAQILDLLRDLQRDLGMAILLITHDLGVVAELAGQVVVMYAGRVVERASAADLFERPRHPYTAGLFQSLPTRVRAGEPLRPIEGSVPDARELPPGCRFHPRCPFAFERCRREEPPLAERPGGRAARASACFAVDESPELDLLGGAQRAGAAR